MLNMICIKKFISRMLGGDNILLLNTVVNIFRGYFKICQ